MYVEQGLAPIVVCNVHPDDVATFSALLPDAELRLTGRGRTAEFENRYASDGTRSQIVHAVAPPIELDADTANVASWLHLGPLLPDDLVCDWYAARGPIALDVQGLCREIASDGKTVVARAHALPRVDIAKFSSTEWRLQNGVSIGEICITRGTDGGEVRFDAGQSAPWAAQPLAEIRDPTGAGDLFFAAYLTARFVHRDSPPQAATFAARATGEWLQRNAR